MRAGYSTDQVKTARWPLKFFFWALDVAIVNSYILAKGFKGTGLKSRRKSGEEFIVDRQEFQRRLGVGLICAGLGRAVADFDAEWTNKVSSTRRSAGGCWPERQPDEQRQRCRMGCGRITSYQCGPCSVPVCVNDNPNCFRDHVEGD
jgi:hypothetical protein